MFFLFADLFKIKAFFGFKSHLFGLLTEIHIWACTSSWSSNRAEGAKYLFEKSDDGSSTRRVSKRRLELTPYLCEEMHFRFCHLQKKNKKKQQMQRKNTNVVIHSQEAQAASGHLLEVQVVDHERHLPGQFCPPTRLSAIRSCVCARFSCPRGSPFQA